MPHGSGKEMRGARCPLPFKAGTKDQRGEVASSSSHSELDPPVPSSCGTKALKALQKTGWAPTRLRFCLPSLYPWL